MSETEVEESTATIEQVQSADSDAAASGGDAMQYRVTPEELLAKRRTSSVAYVFDLRDTEAFDDGHVPGAFTLPGEHLETNLHRLPFQGDLLFYDGGDGAAERAAQTLHDNAFTDFYFVEEGLDVLMETLRNSPDDIQYLSLSKSERAASIEKVLDEKVRDMLASDGGGLEVVEIEDDRVHISYQGACGGCGSSTTGTLRFIQMALTNGLNHDIEVVPVDM